MAVDDRELMSRAAGGETAAFAILANRYRNRLERIGFLRFGRQVDAEDVAQETLARALQQVRRYQGRAEPVTWLHSIALHVCHRWHRTRRRQRYFSEPSLLEINNRSRSSPGDVLARVLRRESDRLLNLALECLTGAQRDAFELHYLEEVPYEIAARILKSTPQAVRALCHRARGALRRRLARVLLPSA